MSMAIYLTVDGGTTNTRIYLLRDGVLTDSRKLSVGARSGAAALKEALAEHIAAILRENGVKPAQVFKILASGMITSEYGLCPLPHIALPVGRDELYQARYETVFPEVCAIPWCFMRGVRSVGEALEETDVMRGEETELMGILTDASEALYVLPGSHSKHISVDSEGKILSFRTMMTGELFAAVLEHTILRDATDFGHAEIIEEFLLQGYRYARELGINEALFKTRILKNILGATKEQCYSFLLGAVLCDETDAILRAAEQTVVLGGQKQFREALAILLRTQGEKQVVLLTDEQVASSTALGAVRIYESGSR